MTSLDQILFNPEVEDNARTANAIAVAKSSALGDLRRENIRLRRQVEAMEAKDRALNEKVDALSKQVAAQATMLATVQRLLKLNLVNRRPQLISKGDVSKIMGIKIVDVVVDDEGSGHLHSVGKRPWWLEEAPALPPAKAR